MNNYQPSKFRIAYFSPLPPDQSGISDYSVDLLDALRDVVDITLVVANAVSVDDSLRKFFPVVSAHEFAAKRWRFHVALYHMGNNITHAWIWNLARLFPGILVLHDVYLHGFFRSLMVDSGNFTEYTRQVAYSCGSKETQRTLTMLTKGNEISPTISPLFERLVDSSLSVITHSEYAAGFVKSYNPFKPTYVIPHIQRSVTLSRDRSGLNVSNDTVVFACLGHIYPAKQIATVLRVLKKLTENFSNIHLVVVGEESPTTKMPLSDFVRQINLDGWVSFIGRAPTIEDYMKWICTADVVVNLRYPTMGETSGTAIRAMAVGVPVIVSNHGWYSELPDNACVKVNPLSEEELFKVMKRLITDRKWRSLIGREAANYCQKICSPELVAEKYFDTIKSTIERFF